jgi:hypothetical protein
MHQLTQSIKVIKLDNGDDIVCAFPKEQLDEKTGLIRLVKPLLIKYVPQLTPQGFKDYVALIKWAAYTNDEIITIPIKKIMTITNASSEMIIKNLKLQEKTVTIKEVCSLKKIMKK